MDKNMTIDDRSVKVEGNMSNSVITTGDNNRVTVTLPDAASVNIAATMTELRAALARIGGENAGKIARALDDADEEVAKAAPDKAEVADSLTRALGFAKKAGDLSDYVEKIKPLVVDAAGWIGSAAHYAPLLAVLGFSAG
jgi:hypothetical protein